MALGWGTRRQLLYYAVATVVGGFLIVSLYYSVIKQTPTCFDGSQNGDERGVDCGGDCALICSEDALMPTVLWSRSFETGSNFYTAAAYVQNNNPGSAARDVGYSFKLYDKDNLLVVEKRGVTDLPHNPTIPIIEHNINAGSREVVRTQFNFSDTPLWQVVPTSDIPVLRITQKSLSQGGARLLVTLINDSLSAERDVVVGVVLFDSAGVARAAAKSVLDEVPRKSSQEIIFTWPRGNADIVRVEAVALPSL